MKINYLMILFPIFNLNKNEEYCEIYKQNKFQFTEEYFLSPSFKSNKIFY